MEHDLLGYLWRLDEGPALAATETALMRGPELQLELEQLRAAVAPLEQLKVDDELPMGLADRTLTRIRMVDHPLRPGAMTEWVGGGAASRRRWNLAVAVCLFLASGGLALLGIDRLNQRQAHVLCDNNLRGFHQALESYASVGNGEYPGAMMERGRPRAGTFINALYDHLPPDVTPSCQGVRAPMRPSRQQMEHALDYMYTLGYRDGSGALKMPRRSDNLDAVRTPVMSDRPPGAWLQRADPPNHAGGAHVLFFDGHVEFCTVPTVGWGGDHIYLNDKQRIAAGLHKRDAVLGDKDDVP